MVYGIELPVDVHVKDILLIIFIVIYCIIVDVVELLRPFGDGSQRQNCLEDSREFGCSHNWCKTLLCYFLVNNLNALIENFIGPSHI